MSQPKVMIAAREEIATLDEIAAGIGSKIKESSADGHVVGDVVDRSLREIRYNMRKGYEELAHHAYGRTVIGSEIDEHGKKIGNFVYRITQANVSYLDGSCAVIPRNSPIASRLVTAQPGDEAEIVLPHRERYLEVAQVRTFDGPTSLISPTQKPNFRGMALRDIGTKRPIVLENLRAAISAQTAKLDIAPSPPAISTKPLVGLDPTWLTDWKGIFLGDTETLSLGHQFFTRTTIDQENALNVPRGLTFVEGIAGAGKTSVALGRLKFFSNFGTGQFLNDYGLQTAATADFSPIGMVGFVLSHSLKRYLRETAGALDLERLPIKDFDEFRMELTTQYGLTKAFRLRKTAISSIRTKMAWVRAVDASAARAAGDALRKTINRRAGASDAIRNAISSIANELESAQPEQSRLHLFGLAGRIARIVTDIEVREREAQTRELSRRISDVERDRAIRRDQEISERGAISPVLRSLLASLLAPELFIAAVTQSNFPALIQQAFAVNKSRNPDFIQESSTAVEELRALLTERDDEGRVCVHEADLIVVIALAGLIAAGFDNPDVQAGTLSHLYDMRRHMAVFIDEVQDFTEVQVFLMGLSSSDRYDQITLSGDRFQRLKDHGAIDFEYLFPLVPRTRRNKAVFLDINFRQREELASLSSAFRKKIQGDNRIILTPGPPSAVYSFKKTADMANIILKRIKSLPAYATIAVVCGNKLEARKWLDLLEDDLAAEHRPATLSEKENLTRRFEVHFTDARETKGLEFDVVIVPDLASFTLNTAEGRNECYVAITRAKHALFLGCDSAATFPEVDLLVREGLVQFISV